jgi:tRNA threonylcarbamoyl adenosine modification protein YjeE
MKIKNVSEMRAWAREFAKTLRAPRTVALHGDLGTGKTEIARAVIRELCGKDTVVPSPTFTIAQGYQAAVGKRADRIMHFDLYRVEDEAELEETGLSHACANDIVLIEWPEIAGRILPPDAVHIHITGKGDERDLTVAAGGGRKVG